MRLEAQGKKMEKDFFAVLMMLFFAALFHAGWLACRNEGHKGGMDATATKGQTK